MSQDRKVKPQRINTQNQTCPMPGNRRLGNVKTQLFDEFLILGFSKKWLFVNEGKPIEFDVVLTKEGKLVLAANLARTAKTRKVVDNEM